MRLEISQLQKSNSDTKAIRMAKIYPIIFNTSDGECSYSNDIITVLQKKKRQSETTAKNTRHIHLKQAIKHINKLKYGIWLCPTERSTSEILTKFQVYTIC